MLKQYAIYENPKDYPNKFVVRVWEIHEDKPEPVAGDLVIIEDTLEAARSCLPPGLTNISRFSGDDPVIREVWI